MNLKANLLCIVLAVCACSDPPTPATRVQTSNADEDIPQVSVYVQFGSRKIFTYTEIAATPQLLQATEEAIAHFKARNPQASIKPGRIFDDPEREVVYLTFDKLHLDSNKASDGTPAVVPDFFLAYIYQPSSNKLTGYVFVPMA
jgi:hypothetical protein